MAHQYTNLDFEKTWHTITVDLPRLKDELRLIMDVIDKKGINRIASIIAKENISADATESYHRIVDDTGVSINSLTDEMIVALFDDIIK